MSKQTPREKMRMFRYANKKLENGSDKTRRELWAEYREKKEAEREAEEEERLRREQGLVKVEYDNNEDYHRRDDGGFLKDLKEQKEEFNS